MFLHRRPSLHLFTLRARLIRKKNPEVNTLKGMPRNKELEVKCDTHSGIESGVRSAGVVIALALWIRAAVDSDACSWGELVAR